MSFKVTLCPEHNLPLVRHEVRNHRTGELLEYCHDCPAKMTKSQQKRMRKAFPSQHFDDNSPCFYHVHEEA